MGVFTLFFKIRKKVYLGRMVNVTIKGLLCWIILLPAAAYAQDAQVFVPHQAKYRDDVILPNISSSQVMEDSLISFYQAWKTKYLKRDDCVGDGLYVLFDEGEKNKKCVSEGQGYGMVIVAYMAHWDLSARATFDSLFAYYKENRVKNPHDPDTTFAYLMSGCQSKDCRNKKCGKKGGDAATDGDLDIAYALLLADAQWHGKSNVNYAQEAQNIMAAILRKEINDKSFTILKGNAVEKPNERDPKDPGSPDYFDMRPSDFMPAHFKIFERKFSNAAWGKVTDTCYKLFETLQHQQASVGSGLVPDFVVDVHSPKPAWPYYEETKDDGRYAHNACRVPWRVATDYIINGDPRSKAFVDTINRWVVRQTQGSIDNFSEGYNLDGTPIGGGTTNSPVLSFICPFAVAAMVDSKYQAWLNTLYRYIVDYRIDPPKREKDKSKYDYYNNTIKMYTMIILTGKYWVPE